MKSNDQRGLTLLEMIIAVLIIGIPASVVISKFSLSTEEAKLSTLKTNLASIRAAIEFYYAQHDGIYPGARNVNAVVAINQTQANKEVIQQLTRYTDNDGAHDAL